MRTKRVRRLGATDHWSYRRVRNTASKSVIATAHGRARRVRWTPFLCRPESGNVVVAVPFTVNNNGVSSLRSFKTVLGTLALWGLTLLLVAIFLNAGVAKLSGGSGWARAFRLWGFPEWFRTFIGVVEICAAALILVPRTAVYGCVLIVLVMLGAMGTHLFHNEARLIGHELGPALFAGAVAWMRKHGQDRDVLRADARTSQL